MSSLVIAVCRLIHMDIKTLPAFEIVLDPDPDLDLSFGFVFDFIFNSKIGNILDSDPSLTSVPNRIKSKIALFRRHGRHRPPLLTKKKTNYLHDLKQADLANVAGDGRRAAAGADVTSARRGSGIDYRCRKPPQK
ncbi:hypothetical protein EVAR_31676_1 [Eumeta japonica]|uniref:Uncharacterized protein n=1 Tax=Eumeta variegata TaxID=151549 RepID=A0A4C1VT84_EUMVA|nr:hypothetical protein EVAR_31676_1 [Eumeta japonica]